MLEPFKASITKLMKSDPAIPSVVLLQRIRDEGYSGSYWVVKSWVRTQRQQDTPRKEAFFKIDYPMGQAGQVDWGEFGDVFLNGVKIHCFVMVLCYSRLIYVEFTRSEKFEEFIRCHENGMAYFENLRPEMFMYDNLPTAVSERFGSLVRFNARFLAYAGHHHFIPHACNIAKGNEKGRVEDGVKYIRSNFWPGRKFADFDDICKQAREWIDRIANLREHAATGKIPRLIFDSEERAQLKKSNPTPYERDEVFSKEVRPDFHIIYETNQYSVPWSLVGVIVTVRIDSTEIRVFYKDRFVTKHVRCYLKDQKPFTKPEHEKGLIELKPQGKNAHLTWQIARLESYGPSLKTYLECLRYSQRSLRQEISQLLALGTVYGETTLAEVIADLLKRGSIGCDQVELALKRRDRDTDVKRPAPMNLQNDRLSRIPPRIDLRQYDTLIMKSLDRSIEPDHLVNLSTGSKENTDHEKGNHKPSPDTTGTITDGNTPERPAT
jgi:transposase